MISIIIRTRNEAEWLGQCLAAVFNQRFETFEVIIVDNESTDATLEIAARFQTKTVKISREKWSYGRALNTGIAAASGDWIVCLSAHCIPVNQAWLFYLKAGFSDPRIVGVYGRQEPIQATSDIDKRDMWNTLGLERKIQSKDPFFHNANAMISRSAWEDLPFDENVSGVEDRVWAKSVLAKGKLIAYEPLASVYHPHGLNQGADPARAARVVNVIERHNLHKVAK